MTIEFRCPNGHRLSCPDERAGLKGRCPKCRAVFQVPMGDGQELAKPLMPPGVASISDSGVSEPELAAPATNGDSSVSVEAADSATRHGPADEQAPPVSQERIVFLCPNGHRLNCPASMQGRPGKCPHCGAKFLVPELEADVGEEQMLDTADEAAADDQAAPEAEPQPEVAADDDIDFNAGGYAGTLYEFDFASLTSDGEAAAGEATGHHAMAAVFQKLWAHKRTGAIVELYLKGGEVIAPEWYSPRASHETYGMFAYAEGDGSYAMTAVQWDAVERIAVRRVNALPHGMFDEQA